MSGKWVAVFVALVCAALLWQQNVEAHRDDPRRHTGDAGIVLLSAQWCGYCRALRTSLKEHAVPFRELDIETSTDGKRAYAALLAHGIPVLVVGQQVVYGYDVAHVDGLLKPLGYSIQGALPSS